MTDLFDGQVVEGFVETGLGGLAPDAARPGLRADREIKKLEIFEPDAPDLAGPVGAPQRGAQHVDLFWSELKRIYGLTRWYRKWLVVAL